MAFVRADEFQFGFLLLSSTSVFQLGFGSGRTFFKSPNIAKPCSLAVMLTDPILRKNLHMRLLTLIYLLAYLTSCNAQQQSNSKNQGIDTAKLFDPSRENDGIAKIVETRNAIILQKDFYDIILGDNEYPIVEKEKVAQFLLDSSKVISKKKFYIITDSSKSFKDIVDIIDIVKSSKIEKYQVFNLQTRVKPPPIELLVKAPTSVSNKFDLKDSTYLKIYLQKSNYKVSFLANSLTSNDINQIDNFIVTNKPQIDAHKILVIGTQNVSIEKFKAVREVLKKYEYFKFSLVTEPNDD